ncbi:MAG: putative peptidoglycan lipid flippase [Methylobacteriaceae bacterium]|nr:putative peptidoglycan lipid flippase [Methylobacteriaceae bacterium]
MLRSLLTVGGWTIASRVSGFFRDVLLSAVLGAGLIADAFVVAFRLPNHFRAIFGEGAFNSAYVPAYSRSLGTQGPEAAKRFSGQIFTLLLISQLIFLALALVFTPELVRVLAPGFERDPEKFAHAVTLTRITFPYLLCMTLVTLQSGTLNANGHFAAAAFAPVILNLTMIVFVALAFLFPDAGVASSVGVTVSGVLQLALMIVAARRAGVLEGIARPRWSDDVRRFFRALAPAVIGAGGVQIALFADTIISSLLPTGGPSSIYYADRIYQLPIGVIGIAAGTVLLPEMSRLLAAGDNAGARDAQNRTMALTLTLAAPFFVAFLIMPDLVMRAAFVRGRFTVADADAAAAVLAAYGIGLLAVVLIRSAVASFQAKGDTTTPMIIALVAVAANVALKLMLFRPFGASGLAFATAIGAWINLVLLVVFALRGGTMQFDDVFTRSAFATAAGAVVLANVGLWGREPLESLLGGLRFANQIVLVSLTLAGGLIYCGFLLFGLRALGIRFADFSGRVSPRPV